jgi:outer membrane receptor protein involved in Fe transport
MVNGNGQTSIFSGVLGGELQLTRRLRADLGIRVEYNDYVESSENITPFDLDGDPATTFDNEMFGNNSYRHFALEITDWAGSLGLNFAFRKNLALYAAGSRGYKMPALDAFVAAAAQEQVDLFDAQQVQSLETGVKGQIGNLAFTVNGFYTNLRNIVDQGFTLDSLTGRGRWFIVKEPELRSYGAEVEMVAFPLKGLQLLGNGTVLDAEFSTGTHVGTRFFGVPRTIGTLAGIYSVRGIELRGDFHWVASRPVVIGVGPTLPAYHYFNFGAGYTLPGGGARIELDLLNAFQSKGLEEGDPELQGTFGSPFFLARPILPRRLTASITYLFGGRSEQS